jgi:hypothetical protein
MVYVDGSNHTFLEVRRGRKYRYLIRLVAGRLAVEKFDQAKFARNALRVLDKYPLERAIDRFWDHGCQRGMSDDARGGLEGLKAGLLRQLKPSLFDEAVPTP